MKKVLAVVAAVGCLAATYALAGIPAGSGVNGSLHDMTAVVPETADEMGRVCVYCHTPHHAVVKWGANDDALPLWNHKMVSDEKFDPYIWATPNNWGEDKEFDIVDPLAGPSRLCMSCHDGLIAIDQHGEAFGQVGGTRMKEYGNTEDGPGRANLTRDLTKTHPIGFNYNEIAAYRNGKAGNGSATAEGASEIVPSTFGFATGIKISKRQGVYNEVLRGDGINNKLIADTLFGGEIMTCATCHEVHNKENATQDRYLRGATHFDGLGGTQNAPNYFLYAKQTESLICLSCHIK